MRRAAGRELKGVRPAEMVAGSDLGAGLLKGEFVQVRVVRRGAVTQGGGRLGYGHDQNCSAAMKQHFSRVVKGLNLAMARFLSNLDERSNYIV
ncbi:hypothetical protein ACI3L1_09050 [Deinococcus sp. SM5_A1]|uniref:hypothetical protein n=1 Tax=Deinococcus sp. SM5_A1 TaxID=3379094 RepID=UPI003858BD2F